VGTGEIDLWNILRLEPAMIKIDMSLVRDLENSPRNGALIRGLAAMAGDLGVVVVAEGVETVRERDRLLELGVEHGQGYLFGKPQPLQWHTRVLGTG
jgi:EAL domain-containing protein (putative c-di-GMP-specific phosphodiesterase class I)